MGINFKKLYEGRLEEIEIQIKKAIIYKKWHEKTKLEAEKECKCAKTADEAKHLGKKEVRKDAIGNMENFKKITENLSNLGAEITRYRYERKT